LLLIAGTGSICLGMDENGKNARSGGFGRILGDEGSGYWIAIQALREALRGVDGRGESTGIPDLICEEFGLNDLLDDLLEVVPKVSSGEFKPEKIASLTRSLLPCSGKDPLLSDIIRQAGKELADLVENTARKLELKQIRLALWGGLWNSPGRELQAALELELDSRPIACQIVEPAEPPERGAVRYLRSLRH
jgi:N-acetylglucosamine kinase-like BadF-type ATPase